MRIRGERGIRSSCCPQDGVMEECHLGNLQDTAGVCWAEQESGDGSTRRHYTDTRKKPTDARKKPGSGMTQNSDVASWSVKRVRRKGVESRARAHLF